MTPELEARLAEAAGAAGTPCYVVDLGLVAERIDRLRAAFPTCRISYAVKANPHPRLLRFLRGRVDRLDLSSGGELAGALAAGWDGRSASLAGPGKRDEELAAATAAGVEVVAESPEELDEVGALGGEALLRLNPARVPHGFAGRMGGRGSPFGVDEEALEEVLSRPSAGRVRGFHVYAGTNNTDLDALEVYLVHTCALFRRAAAHLGRPVRRVVVGAGFGIPYHEGARPLQLEDLARRVGPTLAGLRSDPHLREVEVVLELGRWLVGPAGWYVVGVRRIKHSRGTDFAIVDGGMHHHLAACGLMGQVIRRPFPIAALGAVGPRQPWTVVGPLCTPLDTLGAGVALPPLAPGDLLAIAQSGAYGRTASPGEFLGHPPPAEVFLEPGS